MRPGNGDLQEGLASYEMLEAQADNLKHKTLTYFCRRNCLRVIRFEFWNARSSVEESLQLSEGSISSSSTAHQTKIQVPLG